MDGGSAGVAGAFTCLTGDVCKDIHANDMGSIDARCLNVMLTIHFRASQLMFMGQQRGQPARMRSRYWLGDSPVQERNAREKLLISEKPNRNATSLTV